MKTKTDKTYTLTRAMISNDGDAESPRDWDNFGTIAGWHSRYKIGDEQPRDDSREWLRELASLKYQL